MSAEGDADIIVVGSGHNGLIAAAYLAAAGKRVLVLERNEYPGGGVASEELAAPGFLSERHAMLHVLIQANPLILDDELGLLSRYGLEYIDLDKPYAAVFDDGEYLPIYRDRAATIAGIERFSPADAQAYDAFMRVAVPMVEMLMPSFFVPPATMQEQMAMLSATPLGPEILRASSMSVADVFAEWFEDPRVRITLSRMASEIILTHPEDMNTGLIAYAAIGFLERYGMAVPRGGGSAFTQACISCIEDHGGTVRTSVDITSILSESGRVIGVRTAGGEELRAGEAVLASIHPHRLGDIVQGLDPKIAANAARTKLAPFTGFAIHAALEEPLRFKAGAEVDQIVMNTLSSPSIDSMNRSFDDLRRGRLPALPLVGAGCPSNVDPSRAPEGKAVLHVFSMTTRNLADGGPQRWNEIKEQVADDILARIGEFTTNFEPGAVIARELVTPLDHEVDTPSFTGGDITGVAMYSQQMNSLRPTPELSQYAVPGIAGLYLAGPFMHPGGGVIGGGRATAIKMFADLGLDFAQFTAGAGATA